MELQEPVTTQRRAGAIPWEAWAFVAAAIVAVVVGTITYGFIGTDWFFSTGNITRSLSSALPFLIAAGVVLGADSWAGGRTWLFAGAWLLALHGALDVIGQVQLATITNGTGDFVGAEPSLLVRGVASGVAEVLGFGALAVGLWRSGLGEWHGWRRPAAVAVAVVTALAAAGPLVAAGLIATSEAIPPAILSLVFAEAEILVAGALGVSAVYVAPRHAPVPEALIAIGAALHAAMSGLDWWMLATMGSGPVPDLWLGLAGPVGAGALVILAAGFASGAYFGAAAD